MASKTFLDIPAEIRAVIYEHYFESVTSEAARQVEKIIPFEDPSKRKIFKLRTAGLSYWTIARQVGIARWLEVWDFCYKVKNDQQLSRLEEMVKAEWKICLDRCMSLLRLSPKIYFEAVPTFYQAISALLEIFWPKSLEATFLLRLQLQRYGIPTPDFVMHKMEDDPKFHASIAARMRGIQHYGKMLMLRAGEDFDTAQDVNWGSYVFNCDFGLKAEEEKLIKFWRASKQALEDRS